MKTGTVIKGAAVVGGVVAVGVLFKLFAVPVLIATLVIAVVAYFWKKFVDFWLDSLQTWVDKNCGHKICSALGNVIAFLNTPISKLRKGNKVAFDTIKHVWSIVREGLTIKTRYKKDGEDVIIETSIKDSDKVTVVQRREWFYDVPADVRTEIVCNPGQCTEIDNNHDIFDRKFSEIEKQLYN